MQTAVAKQGFFARFIHGIVVSFRLTMASFRMVFEHPKMLLFPACTLAIVTMLVVTPLSLLVWGLKYHTSGTGTFFSWLYFVTYEAAKTGHWGLAITSAIAETYLLWSLWMIPVLTAVLYFATIGMHVATQQIKRHPINIREAFKVANMNFKRILALAVFSATIYAWIRYVIYQVLNLIPFVGRWILGGVRLVLTAVTYLMLPIVVYEKAGARDACRSAWTNVKKTWSGLLIGTGFAFFSTFMLFEVFIWGVAQRVIGVAATGVISLLAGAFLFALSSAVAAALRAALYWYATTGEVPPGFPQEHLPAIAERRLFTQPSPNA